MFWGRALSWGQQTPKWVGRGTKPYTGIQREIMAEHTVFLKWSRIFSVFQIMRKRSKMKKLIKVNGGSNFYEGSF